MNEVYVPIAMFLVFFGIVTVVMYFRFRSRRELQLTIRAAIESGQSMSTEMLEELSASLRPRSNDLRRGVVLIALGMATIVLAAVLPDEEAKSVFLGLSAFPFFVGFAYVIMAKLSAKESDEVS